MTNETSAPIPAPIAAPVPPAAAAVAPTPLIVAENLGKTYDTPSGPLVALAGFNLTVNPGDIIGLMGPNGAGKSTTMRLLAGAIAPTTGRVEIAGHPLATDRIAAQKKLGYLPENTPQEDDLTPAQLIAFHADVHRVANPAATVETVAKLTRCYGFWNRAMGGLSKGMKQRVHLACALVHNPPVLLLDEPTDGLDPNQKHELRHILTQLAAPRGVPTRAIVVSTHLLDEAETLCTRVVVIHRGQKLVDTTPEELARQGKGDIQLAFRVLTTNRAGG